MESYEWKFDGVVKYRIVEVHVDTIRPGDTVLLSDGLLHTVGKKIFLITHSWERVSLGIITNAGLNP